jgi:mannitol/fructose-specific phosphotransferase system IIA component (Ntr-type)
VDPLLTDEDCIKVGEKLSKIKPKNHSDHIESKDFHDAMESLEMIQEIVEQDLENEEKVDQIRKILEEFFYKKEEKMLSDLLIADAIQLNVECDDWKSAIRASAKYLLKIDAITENYVEMIHNVIENGPYIVVAPGFALPHEAINAGAKKVGMSLIRLKNPVFFGREEMDPVEWICCLSAIDNEIHLKAMFQLVNLFYNEEFRKKIKSSKTSEEVFNMIKRFEYEMR